MKRLLAWLGIIQLVWTMDGDGGIRLRKVRKTGFGLSCCGIYELRGTLETDGTISNGVYVKRWVEYEHNLRKIVFRVAESDVSPRLKFQTRPTPFKASRYFTKAR